MRREQTRVWDLALQKPCAVHLQVCLETAFRGPALGLFPMAGRARAGLRRRGQREARHSGREKGSLGGHKMELEGCPWCDDGCVTVSD